MNKFVFLALLLTKTAIAEQALKKNYFVLELGRNHPISDTKKNFEGGDITTFFGFRHTMLDKWIMGLHGGFKQLRLKPDREAISIFTVSQETYYLLPIHIPHYVAIGTKLLYILPTKGKSLPPEREDRFTREVGIAYTASYFYRLNRRVLLNLRIDRWRGVDREVFQGTETAVGFNYSLP